MDKKQLRQHAKQIRAGISDEQRESDAENLKNNVMTRLNDSSIRVIHNDGMDCMDKPSNDERVVGTYYPIGTEIIPPFVIPTEHSERRNLRSLDFARDDSVKTALPVIRNKTTLEFYPWSPDMRLVKRDFDIPIPDTRGLSPIHPDILLVPLLLCDEHGNRLGYGAGHYDRYIAACVKKPYLIGVCFEEQIWPEPLPFEPHDIPLDLIVTPKRIIEP